MAYQFFIPSPTKKGAITQLNKNLRATNKDKPKREQYELKSLKKEKSILKGGRPFYIAKIRKKK